MAFFCRIFAEFHSYCRKYKEATLNIIIAMRFLHKALVMSNSQGEYPELVHYRFEELYRDIVKYYQRFCNERYVSATF